MMQKESTYDLVNKKDIVVGRGTKEEARKRRLFTRSVHVFLFDEKGRLLLCTRPLTKKTYPGKITSSAGGHVDRGESHEVAATRELQEELGIRIPLHDYGRFDVISRNERTIHRLFVGYINEQEKKRIRFDKTEIEKNSFRTLSWVEKALAQSPEIFALPFRRAYAQYRKPRTIVVDFDHTLFNWYAYKKELATILKKNFSVSSNSFTTTKDAHEAKDGFYHVESHLRELAKRTNIPYAKLYSVHAVLIAKGARFLYPDALQFIRREHKKHSTIILLTYGNVGNQRIFVRGTGMDAYYSKAIYVERKEEKIHAIKRLLPTVPGALIMINDDPKEGRMTADSFGFRVRNILIERPDAKFTKIPRHEGYEVVRDLMKIGRF